MKQLFSFALLFLAISLQVHARESQFFSKSTHSEDPSTNYNYNPNTNNNNNAAFMDQSNSIPSNFASEFNDNKERSVNGNVPSSFASKFSLNKAERDVNNIPSSSSFTSSELDENRERNVDNTPSSFASEFPGRAFNENQEYHYNVNNRIPKERSYDRNQQFGMSDTRFLENGRYFYDRNQQFGMSDTRFLENGRYFYDVKAERNRGQYERNNNVGGFGSWHGAKYRNNDAYGYTNEMQSYHQENQKRQDEYYDR